MARIRVVTGRVGFYGADHSRIRKTYRDDPFECEDATAAFFVSQGIAEYTDKLVQERPAGSDHEGPTGGNLGMEELEAMTMVQLKQLAGDLGINTTGLRKKDELIEVILSFGVQDEDEFPDLDPEAAVQP